MSATPSPRLKNFPISWFAMIMGMAGFTIAWGRAEQVLGLGVSPAPVLLPLTTHPLRANLARSGRVWGCSPTSNFL